MTGPMVCISCGGDSYWAPVPGIMHRSGRKYTKRCPGPPMRQCSRCREHLPVEDFWPMRTRPPGTRQAWCKACFREYRLERGT